MQPHKTTTITITREEYRVDDVPGVYYIDHDGRWYEVTYCPLATPYKRIQIQHTDLHEKAISALQTHAARIYWDRRATKRKEDMP